MFRRILAAGAVAALAVSALGVASASATQQTNGAYWQQTNGLRCALPVQGGDPGGRVIVNVHGGETRAEGVPFQTTTIYTRLVTQKLVDDQWQTAFSGDLATGRLDVVRQEGDHFFGPFMWDGFGNPDFPNMEVAVPTSGIYRVYTRTRLFQQDGLRLAILKTWNGNCTFAGKR